METNYTGIFSGTVVMSSLRIGQLFVSYILKYITCY